MAQDDLEDYTDGISDHTHLLVLVAVPGSELTYLNEERHNLWSLVIACCSSKNDEGRS